MEITTKIFLINWVVYLFICFIDRHSGDIIEKMFPKKFQSWAAITCLSVPAWVIWLICGL